MNKIMISTPNIIPKGWGCEIIFASNELYCGKILRFNAGGMTSMHFHASKVETWYVASGRFLVRMIDPRTAERRESQFLPGSCLYLHRNAMHQLVALDAGDIFEVSTKDDANDSYRVEGGSSQQMKQQYPPLFPQRTTNMDTSM